MTKRRVRTWGSMAFAIVLSLSLVGGSSAGTPDPADPTKPDTCAESGDECPDRLWVHFSDDCKTAYVESTHNIKKVQWTTVGGNAGEVNGPLSPPRSWSLTLAAHDTFDTVTGSAGNGVNTEECVPVLTCTDRDGDGYGTGKGCEGPDCDERDPEVHEDCEPPCIDRDGDGFGRGPACEGPDCDDSNPEVHDDCEPPTCEDGDGDGFGVGDGCEGPDCDDDDPALNVECPEDSEAEAELFNLGVLNDVDNVISNSTDTDDNDEDDEGTLSGIADGMNLIFAPQPCPIPIATRCGLLYETDDDGNAAETGVLIAEGTAAGDFYIITSDCSEARLVEGFGYNLWDELDAGSGGSLSGGLNSLSLQIQESGNVINLDLGGIANDPSADGPFGELIVGHADCDVAPDVD